MGLVFQKSCTWQQEQLGWRSERHSCLERVSVAFLCLCPFSLQTHTPEHTNSIYTHRHNLYHSCRSSILVPPSCCLVTPSLYFPYLTVLYILIYLFSPTKRSLAWERQRGSVWNGVGEAEWPWAQVAAVLWLLCQVMVDGRMDAPCLSLFV